MKITPAEADELLEALDPDPTPETVLAALAFEEMHKPWGDPVRMTDTQPLEALDPDKTIQSHRGFALVDEEPDHGDD